MVTVLVQVLITAVVTSFCLSPCPTVLCPLPLGCALQLRPSKLQSIFSPLKNVIQSKYLNIFNFKIGYHFTVSILLCESCSVATRDGSLFHNQKLYFICLTHAFSFANITNTANNVTLFASQSDCILHTYSISLGTFYTHCKDQLKCHLFCKNFLLVFSFPEQGSR
jgi:hypothetical protein